MATLRPGPAVWLEGWTLEKLPCDSSPFGLFPAECEWMAKLGSELFASGVLPELNGVAGLPEVYRLGTGGNLAVRVDGGPGSAAFAVTTQGAHKGLLGEDDFAVVCEVKWERRVVYYIAPEGRNPSSDSLLAAQAFLANQTFNAWVHTHLPLAAAEAHEICIPYPASSKGAWECFRWLVAGSRLCQVINLIDHDVPRKGPPNGMADSSIILCETMEQATVAAKELVGAAMSKGIA